MIVNPLFLCQCRQLVVVDMETSSVLWAGNPDGLEVLRALWDNTTNDAILLLADVGDSALGYGSYVARVRIDGSVVWKISPPEQEKDAFTEIQLTPLGIFAAAWSGWNLIIDPETGRVTESVETH